MSIDRLYIDFTMRSIEEKIKEQEIVLKNIEDEITRRLVENRITQLKVELNMYAQML